MRGGSKPGERRGGRQKGTRNKVTADIKQVAQMYGAQALKVAADILQDVTQPSIARLAAANLLLDRGYGKPGQHLTADVTRTHEDRLADMERRAASALESEPGQC